MSSAEWGDYDNDGDLDFLLTGYTGSEGISRIYKNDGGSFSDIGAGLPGVWYSGVAWGDYDNDGDLDILLSGTPGSGIVTSIFNNDGGSFTDIEAGLPGVGRSSAAWGDYDNDGDLDMLLTGSADSEIISKIFRNNTPAANTAPNAPANLIAEPDYEESVTLSWNPATDDETPQAGLTYNLRVSTTPGGQDILSPMSSIPDGLRRVPVMGSQNHNTSWTIEGLSGGTYYWSVQAVDQGFMGSAFTVEGKFLAGPVFEEITTNLTGVYTSSVAWGDYDNDGDLDVLITGSTGGSGAISEIHRNDGGMFTDIDANLIGVRGGSAAWGDYDNDGDLDILLTGALSGPGLISCIYRNDGGHFYDIDANLPGIISGNAAWGDYDNDGDLDILLTGAGGTGTGDISRIYKNDNGIFSDINAGLPGVSNGNAAWGDYDNDGDLDILLTGYTGSEGISRIYLNDGGIFSETGNDLLEHFIVISSCGDYDNDGDLDVLLTGARTYPISKIYNNESGSFSDIGAPLPYVYYSNTSWGDYDNDGDLDILFTGDTGSGYISKIYRNDSGSFFEIDADLPGVYWGNTAWGDYDNDGDLDILLTGNTGSGYISKIYRNNTLVANTAPDAPANLVTVPDNEGSFTLSWDQATDNETPQPGLTYNLRVGTTPGGQDILAPMSSIPDGLRKVPAMGSQNHNTSWTIERLPCGETCYWSVQAVDHGFMGSAFSAEGMFKLNKFDDICASLPGVNMSSAEWGDYDNDGDLDILLTGSTGSESLTRIYENNGGSFSVVNAGLPGVYVSSAEWGDYDNDGDLDILLIGDTRHKYISRIYKNDGGSFSDIGAGLPGVNMSSAEWGDYDNDGDLDFLLSGYTGSKGISRVYKNDGGSFSDIGAGLKGVYNGDAAWGDYDNDGDLDILLAGRFDMNSVFTKIYRNDGGSFSDIGSTAFCGVYEGSAAWGDYDNDGDLDILLTGYTGNESLTRIYENNDGSFSDIGAGLPGVFLGGTEWGDYDNDGDLDILLTGQTGFTRISRIYNNEGGSFSDIGAGLTGIGFGSADWGDYDNDGDLDVLITGYTGSGRISRIYRNNTSIKNNAPNVPANLIAAMNPDGSVTLSWDPATDNETPQPGLTYNLRMSTVSENTDIVSPMADSTGWRKIPAMGYTNHNTGGTTGWTIQNLGEGNYFWTVQAIDHGFMGSPFASEKIMSLSFPGDSVVVNPVDETTGEATVSMTFENATEAGSTTLESGDTGPDTPTDFSLGDPPVYYNLETTVSFSGAVQLCFDYSGIAFEDESLVRLLHYENSAWIDVTTALDMEEDLVYGEVTSLSPFGLMQKVVTEVAIDVKPRSDRNRINPKSNGVTPVAILTTESFNALTVDHASVLFGKTGLEAAECHTDKKTGLPKRCEEDVDGDGDLDLVFHFETQETGIQAGDEEAILTGELFNGHFIQGRDAIITDPGAMKKIAEQIEAIPKTYGLSQNYPNPFNPETLIHFQLPESVPVVLRIFNSSGQVVRSLVNRTYEAGYHSIVWDAMDNHGRSVSSGIYIYHLKAGNFTATRKLVLQR